MDTFRVLDEEHVAYLDMTVVRTPYPRRAFKARH
jgi:hypothetical protein